MYDQIMERELYTNQTKPYSEQVGYAPLANVIRTLERIEKATHSDVNNIRERKKQELESGDEFIVLKNMIHENLKEIIEMIEKRNNMDNGPDRAKLGRTIRLSIKRCENNFENLKKIKVKGKKEEKIKKREIRQKIMEIINENITECKRLERGMNQIDDENVLDDIEMGIMNGNIIDEKTFRRNLQLIDLPEAVMMNENEKELDRLLDILGNNVLIIKDIANEQQSIINETTQRIQIITEKAEDVNDRLYMYNDQLYQIIHAKNPGYRMCLQITVILLLLGVVGAIISLFS